MVLICHHNRGLSPPQPKPHRLRQHISIGRGRRPKRHLRPLHPHQPRQTRARLIHLGPARLRPRIGAIGLHFAIHVKPMQPIHHLTAGIRSPGVLKKRMASQHSRVKSRKLAAHEIQIKLGHQTSLLRFKTTARRSSTDKQGRGRSSSQAAAPHRRCGRPCTKQVRSKLSQGFSRRKPPVNSRRLDCWCASSPPKLPVAGAAPDPVMRA